MTPENLAGTARNPGLRVWGLGFGVYGLEFGVLDLGFRASGLFYSSIHRQLTELSTMDFS